jgi:hypothetical protein
MARWETTGPFSYRIGRTGLFFRAKILLEYVQCKWREDEMRRGVKNLAAIIFVCSVAACAPPPVKVAPPPIIVPPPPSPPPVMPTPPGGAALSMTIPPLAVDGIRSTPNRLLSPDENIWHLRSAFNVAALNCQGPVWGQVAVEYNKYIVVHKTRLNQVGKAIDRAYVARYPGQNGLRVRDSKMTDLYNYFALPPVKAEFCDTSLRRLIEGNAVPSATLTDFSLGALAEVDGIFIRFFDAYVQYERNLAEWNMKYAPRPALQPVFVPNTGTQPQPVFAPNTQPKPPATTTKAATPG